MRGGAVASAAGGQGVGVRSCHPPPAVRTDPPVAARQWHACGVKAWCPLTRQKEDLSSPRCLTINPKGKKLSPVFLPVPFRAGRRPLIPWARRRSTVAAKTKAARPAAADLALARAR